MRRSTRQTKVPIFLDDTPGYIQPSRAKKAKKPVAKPPETRPAEDPPAPVVQQLADQPPPEWTPPIQVQFESFKVNLEEREPIDLWLKLFGPESLLAIVAATNLYARSQMGPIPKNARKWHDLNSGELLCWLALLFYMGSTRGRRVKDYWPSLRRFMS